MKSKFINVNDTRIHYLEYGSIHKPSLLLIHGFHGNATSINFLSDYLSQIFHVITPDLPGFGKSDEMPCRFTIVDAARYMNSFTASLNIKNLFLCGISMGGAIVLEMRILKTHGIEGYIFMHPLFDGTHLKLAKKGIFLKALVNLGKNPLSINTFTKVLFNNEKILEFLVKKFSTSKPLTTEEITFRLNNIKTCTPSSYVYGIYSILHYRPSLRDLKCNKKMLLFINSQDELIDPAATIKGYQSIFPENKIIEMKMEQHNPHKKLTSQELKNKFPQFLSDIKKYLGIRN